MSELHIQTALLVFLFVAALCGVIVLFRVRKQGVLTMASIQEVKDSLTAANGKLSDIQSQVNTLPAAAATQAQVDELATIAGDINSKADAVIAALPT